MIRHVSSIAEIVADLGESVRFYRDGLGLEVEHTPGEPYAVVKVPGVLHFGLWAREAAAESLFGDPGAGERVPLGFLVEFEADDIAGAEGHLSGQGRPIAQERREESWGQTTCRLFTPAGALCGLTETPWARRLAETPRAEPDDG